MQTMFNVSWISSAISSEKWLFLDELSSCILQKIMSSILNWELFTNPADKPSFSSLLKSSFIFATSCLITFVFSACVQKNCCNFVYWFQFSSCLYLLSLFLCYLRVRIIIIFFSASFLIVFPVLLLFLQILGVIHPLVVFLCKPNSTVIQIY